MQIDLFNISAPCFQMTANTTTGATPVQLAGGGNVIRIVNEGPNIAYISVGHNFQAATVPGVLATNTCCPVLPFSDVSFFAPHSGSLQLAAVTAIGSAVLNIQLGTGQ
jgi:hypothetical protein